jgi:hypothetical protein
MKEIRDQVFYDIITGKNNISAFVTKVQGVQHLAVYDKSTTNITSPRTRDIYKKQGRWAEVRRIFNEINIKQHPTRTRK